jgi:YVTN family beta-propeller protein
VMVIDTSSFNVVKTIAMGERPVGIAVLPNGEKAYVAHGGSNDVRVIDVKTDTVTKIIPIEGERVWWAALTPDGKKLYVTAGRSHTVAVIDTTTDSVVQMIPVGTMPWGVAISRVEQGGAFN